MAKTLIANPTTQNGIDYVRSLEKLLNTKKKELLVRQQNEIIRVYQKAYLDIIDIGLKKAGGDKRKLDRLIKSYSAQIYDELDKLVTKYNKDISDEVLQLQRDIMYGFIDLEYYEFKEQVDKLVDVTNRQIVQQMIEGGIYHDGKGLSERIWDTAKTSGNKMSIAINSCIAQGMGAAEMSQNLKEFAMGGHHTWSRNKIKEKLGPGYARKYSSGLDYESLRLARTTLTHQAQIAVINSSKINPYLQFVKWHSDHQAGRTCQQCIDRDGKLFPIDEVPLDHPNGMCWIQPVYSIDGKTEATPEEIAKDMKAWAEGGKNSKLMNTIPEYKGLGGTKKPVKPKTTKKTKKQQTNKDTFNKLTEEQIQEYKNAFLNQGMKKRTDVKYLNEAVDAMLNDYPEHLQQAYYQMSKNLKGFWETNKDEAYYSPSSKIVCMSSTKENKNVEKYKYYKFDVWFHETGHAMDHLLTLDAKGGSTRKLSQDSKFQKALVDDYNEIKKKLFKEYQTKYKFKDEDMQRKFATEKSYGSLFYKDLAGDHRTKGIQDVIEGLSNGEIRIKWGHGKKYWNRSGTEQGRMDEVASEAWANICGAYGDKDTLELMNKYFPNAVKELDNIIKKKLKELK